MSANFVFRGSVCAERPFPKVRQGLTAIVDRSTFIVKPLSESSAWQHNPCELQTLPSLYWRYSASEIRSVCYRIAVAVICWIIRFLVESNCRRKCNTGLRFDFPMTWSRLFAFCKVKLDLFLSAPQLICSFRTKPYWQYSQQNTFCFKFPGTFQSGESTGECRCEDGGLSDARSSPKTPLIIWYEHLMKLMSCDCRWSNGNMPAWIKMYDFIVQGDLRSEQ